jgi:2-isopropylmalate synthase
VETIRIFDTTLRDGEQSPGVSLSAAEKVEIARWLARMGVDVIEAGFPAASGDERRAVERVAREVGQDGGRPMPTICALARATDKDIDAAWDAVRHAEHPRIHTFLAASDLHLEYKLCISRSEALEQARAAVERARSYCDAVQFSPEDASRADPDFLCEMVEAAIEAGATTINIPDTVGYAAPDEYGALIGRVVACLPSDGSVVVSVHCHDDLGLATANTLAGLRAGARQAEVTINGIGERAGNTALEEIVMSLATRSDHYALDSRVDATRIARASRMVSHYTGLPVQPNKAIVGANAFAHEAGIHQDGVLKHQATYEIMRPESVGLADSSLVLGKHSGRHAFSEHVRELGYELDPTQLEAAFHRFKEVAGVRRDVSDADVEALIADLVHRSDDAYRLVDLQVVAGRPGLSTATARLLGPDEREYVRASVGTGPVDAIYRAIDAIVRAPNRLEEFRIHAVTEGVDAQGAVSVRVSADGLPMRIGGYGADTDILVASAHAYINALNRLIERLGPPPDGGAEDWRFEHDTKESRMREGTEDARSDGTEQSRPGTLRRPSHREEGEIEGWALQWDSSALRKTTLARTMRQLREGSTEE